MLNTEPRLLDDEVDVLLETETEAEIETETDIEAEILLVELYEEQEAHREHGFYVPTREELLADMGGIFRHLAANY